MKPCIWITQQKTPMLKVTTKSPGKGVLLASLTNHAVLRQCLHWLNCRYRDLFADHRTKKLFTGSVVALFLEATLRNRKSIAEICLHLQSSKWLQEWIGFSAVSESALYTRLEQIPLDLLQEIHRSILIEIAGHYKEKQGLPGIGTLYAVDSTEISLPPARGAWAFTTEQKNFVRMHTCLRIADEASACPHAVVLSTGAVHEQEVLSHLVQDADATYVFDRGYVSYVHFIAWAKREILFVARLKHNNKCAIIAHHPIPEHSCIRLDAEVRIVNPKQKISGQFRLVEYDYLDRHGKVKRIRVLTTNRVLSAEQISEIYRGRWRVETFFKWMKQHGNLKKLYSTKQSAVWNQVYLSLIVHALCELIRLRMKPIATCSGLLEMILLYGDRAVTLRTVLTRCIPTRRKKRGQKVPPRESPPKGKDAHEKNRIIIT